MPVAQWHYPFENQEVERQKLADYICEAIDQTRLVLHATRSARCSSPTGLQERPGAILWQ